MSLPGFCVFLTIKQLFCEWDSPLLTVFKILKLFACSKYCHLISARLFGSCLLFTLRDWVIFHWIFCVLYVNFPSKSLKKFYWFLLASTKFQWELNLLVTKVFSVYCTYTWHNKTKTTKLICPLTLKQVKILLECINIAHFFKKNVLHCFYCVKCNCIKIAKK